MRANKLHVDDVSFAAGTGEFLALIGPNGAGKSTCFNMINGQIRPDSGEILFAGRDIAGIIADGGVQAIRDDERVREVYFGTGRVLAREVKTSWARSLLEVAHLRAWYGAAQVLFDLALEVRRGEVVALMGRNGARKSTTMRAIMGLARHRGTVRFNGGDISGLPPHWIARLGVGITPEDRRIFSDLTALENLDVGRRPPRRFADGSPAPAWTPEKLFGLFPNLRERRHNLGSQMSGVEEQMLTVARTLMGNPLLILLDEPLEGVAPLIVERMVDTIVALKAEGFSILLSEQNLEFARLVSDRPYLIEKGHVQWQGPMNELVGDADVQRAYLTM